jgi:hypothetical protein
MTDLTTLTIPALKAEADKVGATYTSKTKKADLIAAIEDARNAMPVDRSDLVEVELPEWERQLIEQGTQEDGTVVIDDLSDVQRELLEQAQERIDTATTKRAEKPSRVMGLHFRGRAMGAKHHALIRAAMLSSQAELADPFTTRNDFAHKPNSERVQAYARQRSEFAGLSGDQGSDVPTLTHRQMRRVRKNETKSMGHIYVMPLDVNPADYVPGSFSLLARTPDGFSGIHHRFATS